ncbi:hypothetical protein GWK47_030108 [Chionoecetes opilio]|uniref:Uncharacterized protein n=1 Tax=Chionoecetes opilio TaxID=41210 RepID=A0A8J4YK88_CHIOP|nr:hypothetical protein GWK47_030108 [Chionoecetes opilio]
MEYAPSTWSSCPPSYPSLLDKIQARSPTLIRLKARRDSFSLLCNLAAASRRSRSVRRLQDTQAACPAPLLLSDSPGQDHTAPPHELLLQGPSTDRPFCPDGGLSAFFPSTLQKECGTAMVQQTQLHSTSHSRPSRVL